MERMRHRQQMQTEQATEDADGADNSLRHSKRRQHRQQTPTKRAIENVDGADNSPRHSRCKRSGQGIRQCRRGTDSNCRRSKPQKTQTEQTTHQGTIDADKVDKAQIADVNKASHRRHR